MTAMAVAEPMTAEGFLFELMASARAAPDRGLASIELVVRIGERDV